MATAGTINGTILAIYIGGTEIDKQLSASFSFSHEPRESITKDDGGWGTKRPGKKSWEASGDAETAFDATEGYDELSTALINGTALTLLFSTEVSGDTTFTGTAYITKFDVEAGVEEDSKISYAFAGSGLPTKGTVT